MGYLGEDIPPAPKTTGELLELWRSRLLAGERMMLHTAVDAYPGKLTREELGAKTNFVHTGGTFKTYLGTLKRSGLLVEDGDGVQASKTLMEAAVPAGR
jgi:hypothetical protein